MRRIGTTRGAKLAHSPGLIASLGTGPDALHKSFCGFNGEGAEESKLNLQGLAEWYEH